MPGLSRAYFPTWSFYFQLEVRWDLPCLMLNNNILPTVYPLRNYAKYLLAVRRKSGNLLGKTQSFFSLFLWHQRSRLSHKISQCNLSWHLKFTQIVKKIPDIGILKIPFFSQCWLLQESKCREENLSLFLDLVNMKTRTDILFLKYKYNLR